MSYTPTRGSGENCLSIIVEAVLFTVAMVVLIALMSFGVVAVINAIMWVVGL